jgi:hypothetical protein
MHTIHFGVDLNMNGIPDVGQAISASAEVTVEPQATGTGVLGCTGCDIAAQYVKLRAVWVALRSLR